MFNEALLKGVQRYMKLKQIQRKLDHRLNRVPRESEPYQTAVSGVRTTRFQARKLEDGPRVIRTTERFPRRSRGGSE